MLPAQITSLNLHHNELEVIDRSFLTRYSSGLYKDFSFNDNKIKCECNDDFLALNAVSSRVEAFNTHLCGNVDKNIVDVLDECKSRS